MAYVDPRIMRAGGKSQTKHVVHVYPGTELVEVYKFCEEDA
ncbi:hypothetical protein CCACVL1_06087 [Corchorus capsularis]|uniref:Uncharacterized protein n=1 Tax=Corchorus capsularis TaxID=210143 RepID=A0A1R3JHG2_COCAP|nr:hypothetical protein CCACVL1_06087 [Corchorus capsularis]